MRSGKTGTSTAPTPQTPEEKAAFQEAAQPVWTWYEENFGRDWIDAAQSAVEECQTQLDAAFTNATQ